MESSFFPGILGQTQAHQSLYRAVIHLLAWAEHGYLTNPHLDGLLG